MDGAPGGLFAPPLPAGDPGGFGLAGLLMWLSSPHILGARAEPGSDRMSAERLDGGGGHRESSC
ncbi:hypothetical protein AB0F03_20110 [Streptomyces sp. NPDC028722]|uniref:hypothetical protein n=1 Tax=Streptomyces sp. NPDC028722 TaxID=3155016 RepID=UPI0033FC6CA5